jgi:hypothetical protein
MLTGAAIRLLLLLMLVLRAAETVGAIRGLKASVLSGRRRRGRRSKGSAGGSRRLVVGAICSSHPLCVCVRVVLVVREGADYDSPYSIVCLFHERGLGGVQTHVLFWGWTPPFGMDRKGEGGDLGG